MPKTFRIIALSLVGLAVLLAIIAVGIGKRGGSSPATDAAAAAAAATTAAPAATITLVVAARTLTAGKPVALGDLKTVEVASLPVGHYSSPYQAVDALPAREIAADTPLRPELFLRGLSSHLGSGERAIAVAVDEISGVGNRVEPGDYVDVFLALPETGSRTDGERTQPLTRLLASRLRVLSYGSNSVAAESGSQVATAEQPAAAADSGADQERAQAITARSTAGGDSRSNRPASSAVLAVPPDQAGALLLGAQAGRLFLALRNPADTSIADTSRFAEPAAVLAIGRAGESDGALPASADDRAYAGVALNALIGTGSAGARTITPRAPAPARARSVSRATPSAGGSIQIIRGGDAPRPLTTH